MEGSRSVTLTDDYHFELRDIIYYYMGMSVDHLVIKPVARTKFQKKNG